MTNMKNIGNYFIICSRIALFVLALLTWIHWAILFFVIHFLIMLGWIIEQKTTMNERRKLEWISYFKLASIYCFYFSYLKNGNLNWRRRFFHTLISLENLGLIFLYVAYAHHAFLIKVIGSIFVTVSLFLGIIIIEVVSLRSTCDKNTAAPPALESGLAEVPPRVDPTDSCAETSPQKKDPANLVDKEENAVTLRSKCTANGDQSNKNGEIEIPQHLGVNKRETMCSIQDLLANTSSLSNLYNGDGNDSLQLEEKSSRNRSLSNQTIALKVGSRMSINEIGLPLQEASSNHSCSPDSRDTGVNVDIVHSLLPQAVRNPNFSQMVAKSGNEGSSEIDKNSLPGNSLSTLPLKVDVEDHSSIVNTITFVSEGDYENVFNTPPDKELSVNGEDQFCHTVFPPKSLLLLQSVNQSIAAQSSGSHDYENCPAINVYRANTGVRHWKPYFNIADQIHDYSTSKERSLIQDSTLSSNVYGNTFLLSDFSHSRPLSLAEKASSNYSISLPDLTNIESTTCVELERVSKFEDENKEPQNPSDFNARETNEKTPVENCTNYEAIWYDDFIDGEIESPRFTASTDGKLKESLCNLYYSRVSELSANYFAHGMKRNNSLNSLIPSAVNLGIANNIHLSKPRLLLEINNGTESGTSNDNTHSSLPNGMSTPSNKCKRSDSKRTQKSPLMRLVSLSQNSLHEHTQRALQAGRRVFYRPRVHVITPKKGPNEFQIRRKVTDGQAQLNRLKIDPKVLKKRGHLSPKDKLILSEASALIHRRESAAGCKTALGFTTEAVDFKEKLDLNDTDALNLSVKDEKEEGPQHSTPEGNRHHLPQMSILSTISSVASPDEMVKLGSESLLGKMSSSSIGKRSSSSIGDFHKISSSLPMTNGRRCSSKRLNEMSVIEEFESIPSQV